MQHRQQYLASLHSVLATRSKNLDRITKQRRTCTRDLHRDENHIHPTHHPSRFYFPPPPPFRFPLHPSPQNSTASMPIRRNHHVMHTHTDKQATSSVISYQQRWMRDRATPTIWPQQFPGEAIWRLWNARKPFSGRTGPRWGSLQRSPDPLAGG